MIEKNMEHILAVHLNFRPSDMQSIESTENI